MEAAVNAGENNAKIKKPVTSISDYFLDYGAWIIKGLYYER